MHARTEQGGSPADEASARQEPPPKCLVLYAEGAATAVERGRVSCDEYPTPRRFSSLT